jgi:putative FmdB family regulatory protein
VPTYDYQCRSCLHTTEVIHSMLEEGPSTCERCGGELRRVLFPAGIIFKGSGFYKTDSRSSSSGSASSPEAKPPASGESKVPAAGGSESGTAAGPTAPAPSAGDSAKND